MRNIKILKNTILFFLAAAILLLPGCREKKDDGAADGKIVYSIYYTDPDHMRLVEYKYEPVRETFEGMLDELLERFQYPDNTEAVSALPEGVRITGYTKGVDNLTVDFSGSYIGMSSVEEVLLRAAVVKTLVQLPGIYSISLTVDGQPLREQDTGYTIGSMREDTFIDSQDERLNSYSFISLDLFFPAYNGRQLVKESREAFYSSDLLLERVIAEHVIKGPQSPGLLPAVDPAVQINSVRVNEGICTIDLNETFLEVYNKQVEPEVSLYAFADSVLNVSGAKGVMFSVNGSSDVLFQQKIPLSQVFSENTALIRKEEINSDETENDMPGGNSGKNKKD